jgi:energy-coupling factor transporter transmembrane protein EcfT
VLHGLDPRTKLIGLALVGVIGLAADPGVLTASGLLLVGVLWQAQVGPRKWIGEFKVFWVLLLFVLIARGLTVPGTALVRIGGIAVTVEGLSEGGLICLRLWVVALAGIGISATTTPSGIEAALRHLLAPLPLVPERRVATMLGLLVRFLPEVLEQARRTREAQTARCIEYRKNPVRRLALFALPLLRAVFVRADRMSLAMEARCYSKNRTVPRLAAGRRDAAAAGVLVCLVLLSFLPLLT